MWKNTTENELIRYNYILLKVYLHAHDDTRAASKTF